MTLKCVISYIEVWLSMLSTGITYVGKAWFIYLHKNMSFLCLYIYVSSSSCVVVVFLFQRNVVMVDFVT